LEVEIEAMDVPSFVLLNTDQRLQERVNSVVFTIANDNPNGSNKVSNSFNIQKKFPNSSKN